MTRQTRMSDKTEFSIWLRECSELDSEKGFNTTDIDYLWSDGTFWMVLDEKRWMGELLYKQKVLYQKIHNNTVRAEDFTYHGTHIIQFENKSPLDGKIYLDHKEIGVKKLIEFLKFRLPIEYYKTIVFI